MTTPWWWPFSLAALVACTPAAPARNITVAPYPSPTFTKQPVSSVATDTAPSPRPSKTRASRSRLGLPTILLRIRSCESGPNGYLTHGYAFDANYTETNPNSTASGAWQFLRGTWRSTTGLPGDARDYPPAVQDAAALKLYREQGTTPWNASRDCWGRS